MKKQRQPRRSCRKRRIWHLNAGAAIFVGLACRATPARADVNDVAKPSASPADVAANVIALDGDDIVLDLGSAKGGADGAVVEIWRPVKVRHPVTGKILVDRFRIGSLKLVQVQHTLALAQPAGQLARDAAVGDVVILNGEAARPREDRVAPSPPAAKELVDIDARDVTTLFESLRGQPPSARAARYQQYAYTHPKSKYARTLWEEAVYLQNLGAARSAERATVAAEHVLARRAEWALSGESLTIGIEVPGAAGAVLHVRHTGDVAYRSIPMRTAGPGYFRVIVPAAQMRAPEVEYFIESVSGAGLPAAIVGSSETPEQVTVHDAPRPEPADRTDATVALFTDYANYNRMRNNDYAWQTEGYFGLRYRDVGVRALRSGFGVYRGVGGSLEELDTLGLDGRKVGLTYGYLEGEYGVTHFTGLIARLAIGLTDDGVTGGGQFFVRLGNDRVTNLLLGGEVLGGIGLKGIAELQWNTFARVPIVIRSEVTNQPAGAGPTQATLPGTGGTSNVSLVRGDLGARAIVQVGYRFVPSLTLALRASYEGRTIQHAGPGAGLGVTYAW